MKRALPPCLCHATQTEAVDNRDGAHATTMEPREPRDVRSLEAGKPSRSCGAAHLRSSRICGRGSRVPAHPRTDRDLQGRDAAAKWRAAFPTTVAAATCEDGHDGMTQICSPHTGKNEGDVRLCRQCFVRELRVLKNVDFVQSAFCSF